MGSGDEADLNLSLICSCTSIKWKWAFGLFRQTLMIQPYPFIGSLLKPRGSKLHTDWGKRFLLQLVNNVIIYLALKGEGEQERERETVEQSWQNRDTEKGRKDDCQFNADYSLKKISNQQKKTYWAMDFCPRWGADGISPCYLNLSQSLFLNF